MRLRPLVAVLGLALASSAPSARAGTDAAALEFRRDGALVRRMTLPELRTACDVHTVGVDDPYYGRRMSYVGCDLRAVLRAGFGAAVWEGPREDVVLRALDGYEKPSSTTQLGAEGGFLAFGDAARSSGDVFGFEPIDRKQVDPGPFYLVWTEAGQSDGTKWPWPYQLAAIEIARFEVLWPHAAPTGAPAGSAPWRGFELFRAQCISCHAINGEGGRVGPDLNVPKSIVEYRPAAQIEAYVRDPRAFRYTSMPPHRDLSGAQLDDLLAYFRAMKDRKHDPGPPKGE